jgi:DNA-binding transcriptional LysR family regulator
MVEQLDLRRLHTLRVLEQCGTVTGAAELLHLTPSAVSHQMAQLARDLGVTLLERRGRRVYLTSAGHALVAHADDLAARWERARAQLHEPSGRSGGPVRLHGFPSAVAGLLVHAVELLRASHPELRASIVESEGRHGYDLLVSGGADIVLAVATAETPSLQDSRFEQEVLLAEPLDLLVPGAHPLAGRHEARVADLSEDQWIVPVAGSCDFYDLTLAACTIAGFTPTIRHQAKDSLAVSAMVARGLGVALVPRLAAREPRGDAVRIPVADHPRPSRRILACTRAGSAQSATIRAALEAVRAVAASALRSG